MIEEDWQIEENALPTEAPRSSFGRTVLKMLGIMFLSSGVLMAWWVKHNIYASEFTPTELKPREQQVLEEKLAILDIAARREHKWRYDSGNALKPEPYSELGARREISITERELNALIAKDRKMAQRVAIDLSRDLASVKMLLPVEEEVPVLGGKTLRISFGLILSYDRGKPVVALKGVSLGGVPLPNAWLGYLKGVNLVEKFSEPGGFWNLFAAGVRDLNVEEGRLIVKLNE
jgi:hypothetical protein